MLLSSNTPFPKPTEILPLTEQVDKELVRLLHDATVKCSSRGTMAPAINVELCGTSSIVAARLVAEGEGRSLGFTLEARSLENRASAFDLSRFAIHAIRISADDEIPVESLVRTQSTLCCGPLEPDRAYIIQVLKPPPVQAERFRPREKTPGGQHSPFDDLSAPQVEFRDRAAVEAGQLTGASTHYVPCDWRKTG